MHIPLDGDKKNLFNYKFTLATLAIDSGVML